MTEAVTIKVEGDKQAAANLRAFAKSIPKELKPVAKQLIQPVAGTAAAQTPHLTGALAASIRVGSAAKGAKITMGSGSVPYAGWIEFGGSRGRPYLPGGRYLVPALADDEERIIAGMSSAIDALIGAFKWHQAT